MTNKEIYELLVELGMVEEEEVSNRCYLDDAFQASVVVPSEKFENITCKDIVKLTNFVDELTCENDTRFIEKFLVCLLFKNGEAQNKKEKNGEKRC